MVTEVDIDPKQAIQRTLSQDTGKVLFILEYSRLEIVFRI